MIDPVGIAAFAIAVIDDGVVVVKFFADWVKDARHYGEASHAFRVRLLSEVAKLEYFASFMKDRDVNGKSRFNLFPLICQQAVSGLMEELEVNIAAYRDLILKYNIEDLRKSYETHMYGKDGDAFQPPSTLVEAGKTKAKETQKKASLRSVAAWGLFRKKKVEALIATIEGWNAKLMTLLLCGVSFGIGPKGSGDAEGAVDAQQSQTLYDLTLRTGLKLKELVEKDARVDDDFFKKSWVIEPANPPANSNPSVYNLLDTNDKSPEASKPVFVNFKPFQLPRHATEPTAAFKKKVAHLARLLSYPVTPDGGFRTLQCIGLVRHDIPQGNRRIPQYAFVYDLPSHAGNINHNFQTLTEAIASKTETRPTLGERFRLARALAETLFQFHSVNWLHKSVRSDNILLFRGSKTLNYSDPYLVGFEFSRGEGDQSTVDNDDSLNSNLYRHPRRQGLPDERFSILHDIYALGAVLLEIGVWRPLGGFGDFSAMSPDSIKDTLIENGDQRLPHYMGKSYTDAVVACLEGSLAGFLSNSEQDQPLSSENRVKVQIAFWDRVIEVIEKGFAIT